MYIYIYIYSERERDGEESDVVRCHCLKYIYIYIYLCIYTLSHTHRWRGERCGALSILGRESARETHAQNQQDFKPQTPGSPQPDPSQGMGRHSKRVTWAGSTRTREREPREVLVCSWKRGRASTR